MTSHASSIEKLYLLQLANSTVSAGSSTLEMVLGCYLIQTRDGKNILIDTGLPADYISPMTSKIQNGKSVLAALADLDLNPNDIDTLICTHFDPDHAGYHDAFTQAELIVQREHYELARSGHPRFAVIRTHWDHPGLHYRLIDGDIELLPGLTLLKTGGHVPGHQSVLVRLPQSGPVLLAIDAVVMQRLFTTERQAWPMDDNEEQLRDSTQKLLDLVEREQVVLVIFGHDGQQWQSLKKVPDYYA